MTITLAENTRTAANATIKRATAAAHKSMEQLDAQTAAELEKIYRQAAADIGARIAQHAGPDGNLALQEMRSALAQVQAELARLEALRNAALSGGLEQAAKLGVAPYTQGVAASLDTAAGMRVANEALRFVHNFIAEDGLQLSDRIWRIDTATRDGITRSIERAVIQGHSASQAARDMLSQGIGVPAELQAKINAANAAGISKSVRDQMIADDESGALYNAQRLMRTEINRAHGEAYMAGGEGHPDFGGWRYLLSPAHPKPDICDLLSTQNLYGLGPGVYPSRARTPWPAHPDTLSFIVIVFKDEVTDADRAGKETPIQALEKLTPAQQRGVLGKGKQEILAEGKLRQGMIKTPLSKVRERLTRLEKRS
jgi:hypothetical protein